jgi:hypothetical protein
MEIIGATTQFQLKRYLLEPIFEVIYTTGDAFVGEFF